MMAIKHLKNKLSFTKPIFELRIRSLLLTVCFVQHQLSMLEKNVLDCPSCPMPHLMRANLSVTAGEAGRMYVIFEVGCCC